MKAFDDSGALVPELAPLIPEEIEDTYEEQQVILDKDTEALASLSDDLGFAPLKKRYEQRIEDLRTGKALDISPEMTFDIIGQKYIIAAELARDAEEILSLIENAKQAVLEREKQRAAARAKQG